METTETPDKPIDLTGFIDRLRTMPVASPEDLRKRTWKNTIAPRLEMAGFDQRFLKEITVWPEPKQERVLNRMKEKLMGVGAIIALVGPRGTGKTTVCAQLAISREWEWIAYYLKDVSERPTPSPKGLVRYEKLITILNDLKPIYSDFGSVNAERVNFRRDSLCDCGVLVIDEKHDCDDEKLSGLSNRVLTDIIDRRYAKRKDTVIISNETAEQFQKSISDSIRSRITEHGGVIPCEWQSFRTAQRP